MKGMKVERQASEVRRLTNGRRENRRQSTRERDHEVRHARQTKVGKIAPPPGNSAQTGLAKIVTNVRAPRRGTTCKPSGRKRRIGRKKQARESKTAAIQGTKTERIARSAAEPDRPQRAKSDQRSDWNRTRKFGASGGGARTGLQGVSPVKRTKAEKEEPRGEPQHDRKWRVSWR